MISIRPAAWEQGALSVHGAAAAAAAQVLAQRPFPSAPPDLLLLLLLLLLLFLISGGRVQTEFKVAARKHGHSLTDG